MALNLGLVDPAAGSNPLDGTRGLVLEHAGDGEHDSSSEEEPEPLQDEELEVLPDYFGRVSALLSRADGRPTVLCKALYVLLIVSPLYSPGAYGLAQLDPAVGVPLVIMNLGVLLIGAPALHSLQLATRSRRGTLARLKGQF